MMLIIKNKEGEQEKVIESSITQETNGVGEVIKQVEQVKVYGGSCARPLNTTTTTTTNVEN